MKVLKMLFTIFLGLSLNACAVSEEDQVRKVATGFLEALEENDFEGAAAYCDNSTKQLLLSVEELVSEYGGNTADFPNNEFKVTSVVINENEANVNYTNAEGKDDQLYLTKIDGDWKVSIDKEDLDKEEMDKEE